MLNMMIKNGAFGKRYGQETIHTFDGNVLAMGKYDDKLYVHVGTAIYEYDPATDTEREIFSDSGMTAAGTFIVFNRMLYYLNGQLFVVYDGTTAQIVEPYIPDVCINRLPSGEYSDLIDDYNRLGAGFKNTFNGDGTSTKYVLTDKDLDDTPVIAEVDTENGTVTYTEGNGITVDRTKGEVTFDTAPAHAQNNVVITAYKTDQQYIDSVLNNKYWAAYGGTNNSRLFLAGNGNSVYYFSDVFDATYFPESNYSSVGNGKDDITGFGAQYNILVVFKATEMYAISYSFAQNADGDYEAQFTSAQINVEMGCDMPDTILYVDNRLTWGSKDWGICTLCSTVIEDERNVRVISRNINGGYREPGLLAEPHLEKAIAFVYEGKYCVAVNGNVYAWDFTNAPYSASDRISVDDAARNIAWFKWNNINLKTYRVLDRKLYYTNGASLNRFTDALNDFGQAIESVYRTPMFDFGAYHILKTIRNVYFLVRGDTPTSIRIKYITDDNTEGETDPANIAITGHLWADFLWSTFGWSMVRYARAFHRKCSIKKIILFGIELYNNDLNKDMSLSGIKVEYMPLKEIKE